MKTGRDEMGRLKCGKSSQVSPISRHPKRLAMSAGVAEVPKLRVCHLVFLLLSFCLCRRSLSYFA